jgi:hypothetical protein
MTESVVPDSDLDGEFEDELPARPRVRFLTPWTAALIALILGGVGFYVGVRVEKSKTATSSTSGASAFTRALSSTGGATSKTGGASSFASRFAGAGGFPGAAGGAGATIGSISSVNGNTIYVTTTSGNTVKVKLSGATTITKSETVSKHKLFPGDEVVIAGPQGSKGTVAATSVTDSGARSTSTSSTGSTSTGSGTSAASTIKSLFGGG